MEPTLIEYHEKIVPFFKIPKQSAIRMVCVREHTRVICELMTIIHRFEFAVFIV